MKTIYSQLQAKVQKLGQSYQAYQLITEFTEFLIQNQDERLLSISKQWKGYGTWKSVVFVNQYHYGTELTEILEKAIDGSITHDEECEFQLKDFQEKIEEEILEAIL